MNPLQVISRAVTAPPELLIRAVNDLDELADFARRAFEDLHVIAELARRVSLQEAELIARVESLEHRVDEIRDAVTPLPALLAQLQATLTPIRELPAMRDAIDALPKHVDDLEPMIAGVSEGVAGMHAKLDDVRDAVEPLGDLAERIPGARKRRNASSS